MKSHFRIAAAARPMLRRARLVFMATTKHPPRPPMNLTNMREQGVHHLIAFCLNDACRHQALIDVSMYPGDVEVPWFGKRAKCGGRSGRAVSARLSQERFHVQIDENKTNTNDCDHNNIVKEIAPE
jgi:hypothetical protein